MLVPETKFIEFRDMAKANVHKLYNYLRILPEIESIALERVRSLYGMSARSNFTFGYNLGMISTIVELAGFSVLNPLPRDWQAETGVVIPPKTKSKDRKRIIADRALELYPMADIYGPRGGLLDGRSDALMLAHYAYMRDQP